MSVETNRAPSQRYLRPWPRGRSGALSMALVAIAALATGAFLTWQPVAAIACVAIFGASALFSHRSRGPAADASGTPRHGWIALAWGLVLLLPGQKFSAGRDPFAAVQGSLSLDN